MSNEGTQNTAASETVEKDMAEMLERYTKKEKVVALPGDDMELFIGFTDRIGEGNYKDWTKGAPEAFTGLAMVQTEAKANRLVAVPSMDAFFADPGVRKAAYKWLVNRWVNAAGEDDANPAQFVVAGGIFKQKYDLDAFKFQARALVKILREQGLVGISVGTLRQAFASKAFAVSQFPRVKAEAWDRIMSIAEANAKKNDMDVSIFDHWRATRDVATTDTSEIELDFDAIQAADEAVSADGETEGTTANGGSVETK